MQPKWAQPKKLILNLNDPFIFFQYAPHIAPICLPEAGRDPAPGTQAYVAGWGALIPDDVTGPLISILVPEVKRPSVLQVVNVPIVANDRCESWHRDAGIQVKKRFIQFDPELRKVFDRCTNSVQPLLCFVRFDQFITTALKTDHDVLVRTMFCYQV